jgi:hypothetical protein
MMKKQIKENHHHAMSSEKIFLYSGEFILFLALLYLVLNSDEVDSVVRIGIPFMLGAIALILTSRFVK